LTGCGFFETTTVSFVDRKTAELFSNAAAEAHLSVQDVGQKHMNLLRQNLIGPLVSVMQSNANVGNADCRLF
jgi:phenylalanyl-tRNA synthetase beta subunit